MRLDHRLENAAAVRRSLPETPASSANTSARPVRTGTRRTGRCGPRPAPRRRHAAGFAGQPHPRPLHSATGSLSCRTSPSTTARPAAGAVARHPQRQFRPPFVYCHSSQGMSRPAAWCRTNAARVAACGFLSPRLCPTFGSSSTCLTPGRFAVIPGHRVDRPIAVVRADDDQLRQRQLAAVGEGSIIPRRASRGCRNLRESSPVLAGVVGDLLAGIFPRFHSPSTILLGLKVEDVDDTGGGDDAAVDDRRRPKLTHLRLRRP